MNRAYQYSLTHDTGFITAYRDEFTIEVNKSRNKALEASIKDCLYDIELETDTVLSSIIRSKSEWLSSRYAERS